jgi:hypothetical protein
MTTTTPRIRHNRRPDFLPGDEAPRTIRALVSAPPGAILRRLLLGFSAMYFSMVAVTNAVDLLDHVGALHWTFLDSGNFDYMRSIVKVYDVGATPTTLLLAGALVVELVGAALFWRALLEPTMRKALQAVCWSVLVWIGFTFMTEFFLAYTSESPFRELLTLAIGSGLAIALIPEDAGR